MSRVKPPSFLNQLNTGQLSAIEQYCQQLKKWNQVHNLSAIDDEMAMTLHIEDSLSALPYLPNACRCLDVGSGAGLPGIPLAIARPDLQVTMIDSNGKKTRFIQQVILQLSLANAKVVHSRVDYWTTDQLYDVIISRAFSSLRTFIELTEKHLHTDGVLYAMKGRYPQKELSDLPSHWQIKAAHELHVPSLDAERHLIELNRMSET